MSHSTLWNPSTTGNYQLRIWASNLNGSVDGNTANDEASLNIEVFDNFVPRSSLFEVFTSSTCGPCVAGNTNLENIFGLDPNAGTNAGKWTMVKYQAELYEFPNRDKHSDYGLIHRHFEMLMGLAQTHAHASTRYLWGLTRFVL